jgi:tRNA (cytidine56-2'-O)-methyltransferase
MENIPSADRCIEILKENGCSEKVIRHCMAVRDVAVKIAKKANADVRLVEAGALLHDLGRSKTHGILHATEGARIAEKMRLPEKDFIPMTLEEKIVCHADSLVENDRQQKFERALERVLLEGHTDYADRLIKLHKELSDIIGMDVNLI